MGLGCSGTTIGPWAIWARKLRPGPFETHLETKQGPGLGPDHLAKAMSEHMDFMALLVPFGVPFLDPVWVPFGVPFGSIWGILWDAFWGGDVG